MCLPIKLLNLIIKRTQRSTTQKDTEISPTLNSPRMHLVLFSRAEGDSPSPVKLTNMTENIKGNSDLWINRYTPLLHPGQMPPILPHLQSATLD